MQVYFTIIYIQYFCLKVFVFKIVLRDLRPTEKIYLYKIDKNNFIKTYSNTANMSFHPDDNKEHDYIRSS